MIKNPALTDAKLDSVSSYETSEERTPQPCGQLPLEKGSSKRSQLESFCLDQTGKE
jgi:hypothetical protein